MKAARDPGEYQAQTPTRPINGADTPVGFASRMWIKFTRGGIQRGVGDVSKQFSGVGWKDIPQELVDKILGYLLDSLDALKACSLTCKHLFGAARPLIHQRLVCVDSRPDPLILNGSLFTCPKRYPAFERLIDADRSGVLYYTQHLTFEPKPNSLLPRFDPRDMQEYLAYLRSITKLHTLTLDTFHLPLFTPVFNEYFGTFTNTLRHLDIRRASCEGRYLLYIICQFPLLEDLTIVAPPGQVLPYSEDPVPMITQSPPLRGELALIQGVYMGLSEGLAALPGGLNFRSLALSWCEHPRAVLAACGHTATSVSYLWRREHDSEPSPSIRMRMLRPNRWGQ